MEIEVEEDLGKVVSAEDEVALVVEEEDLAEIEVEETEDLLKSFLRYVQSVERAVKFLSDKQVINLYIAALVSGEEKKSNQEEMILLQETAETMN